MDYISYIRSMVGHEKVIMVAAGALVLDREKRVLLQKRTDNGYWGHPGGFMELGETVQDTARREVFEETGLRLGKLEFFHIYSGPKYEKTLANGDQIAQVKIVFICQEFEGELQRSNEESLDNRFFPLDNLPENLLPVHKEIFDALLVQEGLAQVKDV
jgi:ADP-ribose pyrophosphatase YjhB (NUDIX family)